jgi:hypothetical protein
MGSSLVCPATRLYHIQRPRSYGEGSIYPIFGEDYRPGAVIEVVRFVNPFPDDFQRKIGV